MQGRDDQGKGDPRGERLKAALRENLKRRKAQARSRQDGARPDADATRPADDGRALGAGGSRFPVEG